MTDPGRIEPGRSRRRRTLEAVCVGVAGGTLGAAAGSMLGLTVPASVVAAINGVIAGARGIHDWERPTSVLAFTLDSTWALPMTAAALVPHAVAALQFGTAGYVAELSAGADRHVYERGFRVRTGFAITIGNVVSHAGDVRGSPRRMRLVVDHEHVHVWQARWWGPLYPVAYVGWSVAGALAGAAIWATKRRDERLSKVVETCSYYLNPFEWWAYSREGRWPPPGIVGQMGWRAAAVRPSRRVE